MKNAVVEDMLNDGFEVMFEKTYDKFAPGKRYIVEEHEHDYKLFYKIWDKGTNIGDETNLGMSFSTIKHILFPDEKNHFPVEFIKFIEFIYYKEKLVTTYFLYHDQYETFTTTSYFMKKIEDKELYENAMFFLKITN